MSASFPEDGLIRLKQIVGDPKADPPILPLVAVSRSTWLAGAKSGRFPSPVKLGRITAWRVRDVRAYIESLQQVSK